MSISRDNKLWSLATKLGVGVITFAIGMAANFVWTISRTSPNTQQPPPLKVEKVEVTADIGTLKRDIQEAKARGDNTVEIGVLGCGSAIGSLQEELSRDTVVLADLVGKKTYADTFGLRTWYRFKTRETLVEHHPRHLAGQFRGAPSDMLPIAEDEFLIEEANGQMVIDGVTVTQHSNGAKYLEGQTYLLFLWIDPTTRTAIRSASDPLGVFLVDSNGNLSPYVDETYPLRTALAKRFNNSLNDLRRYLEK